MVTSVKSAFASHSNFKTFSQHFSTPAVPPNIDLVLMIFLNELFSGFVLMFVWVR